MENLPVVKSRSSSKRKPNKTFELYPMITPVSHTITLTTDATVSVNWLDFHI